MKFPRSGFYLKYLVTYLAKIDFAIGGQAVIEGVMMRSPNYTVISVRDSEGKIIKHQEQYSSIGKRIKFLAWPFIRGITNLCEMMVIGTKALNFSSRAFLNTLTKEDVATNNDHQKAGFKDLVSLLLTIAFALGLSLFIFKFVPLWITTWVSSEIPILNSNYFYFNLLDGFLKIILFIVYLQLISLIPDMKRVFAYHGAEHKSIRTYEKGLPLTVENTRTQSRFHPRCGTSFVLNVFIISIFIFTVIPKNPDFLINFGVRLAALPIVAACSYELLKWTARQNEQSKVFRIFTLPGLLLQRLTTRDPQDSMLEVAIASLDQSLQLEKEFQPVL